MGCGTRQDRRRRREEEGIGRGRRTEGQGVGLFQLFAYKEWLEIRKPTQMQAHKKKGRGGQTSVCCVGEQQNSLSNTSCSLWVSQFRSYFVESVKKASKHFLKFNLGMNELRRVLEKSDMIGRSVQNNIAWQAGSKVLWHFFQAYKNDFHFFLNIH